MIAMDGTEQKISKRVERELNQTKVVVRHLPPDITEEIFLEKFSPLPPENFTHLYFAPGDPDLGPQGCARAYINFTDETAILAFRDQFDGMVLESQKGHSYRALIEYAPFQNVPKKPRKKLDSRCGTIDQDSDYQSFLQGREERAPTMPAVDFETYMEELKANQVEEVQVTPLIAYLRTKKTASKSSKKKQVFVVEKKKKKSEKGKDGGKVSSRYDLDDKEVGRKDKEQPKVGRKVDVDAERGGARGGTKSSQGSERSSQEVQKNGDVGRRERERNRSGGSRKPDRALYAPKSRDHRSQGKSRSQETADISWTDDVKKPHLNNDTPHTSDRHSSGYDYYTKSSDYSRGRGRGRGRGKGRGRGRGQYTSHETTRAAANH